MPKEEEKILIKLPQKLLLSDRLTPGGITLLYAALSALWIVLSGYLLTLIVADPLLQGRIEVAKGLAFVAVTSGLLYLLLNHWRESHAMQPAAVQTERTTPPKIIQLVLIFIALVLLVPLIGFVIYELNVPQIEKDTFNNLNSIAQIKSEEIENWLNERRGNAQGLAIDTKFAQEVEHFLLNRKHDPRLPGEILNRLDSLQVNHGFDNILLLDTGGQLLSSLGKDVGTPRFLPDLLRRSLSSKQVQFSDIYRDETNNINLDWVVPITVSDQRGKRAVAAMVLRTRPKRFLFPLIQTWPTDSASGETVLVRREGKSVLILNELRSQKNTALNLKYPLDDPALPAAIAIRKNKPGTVSGTDYRQVQVLAAFCPVAGTDWQIIAKIDRSEILMPVWDMLYWISVIASLAVALIMALILMLFRQQQRTHQLALRARSAEVLKESELRYRTLVATIPDLVWLKDKEGVYLNCNGQFEKLYGAKEADIAGKTDYDFVDKALASSFREHDRKAMAAGKPSVNEEWLTFAEDGYRGLFETIKTPMTDSGGNLIGVLGVARDITQRKQAEQQLKESERYFRSLFENMLDGYAYCKMLYKQGIPEDFVYVDVNRAFETLTGLTGIAGKKVSEVIPGIRESNPELFEIYGRVALEGPPERFETYVDSLGIWFSIAVYCPKKEYFVAVFDNITERKRMAQTLAANEARLRILVRSIPDPVWQKDAEGVYLSCNPMFEHLRGADEADIVGKTDYDFLDRELADYFRNQDRVILASGKPSVSEEWLTFAGDGSRGLFEIIKTPLMDGSGKPAGVLGVARDITERKRAEESLRKLSQAVEQSPGTIVITDLKANIEYANAAFVKESGYSLAEAIGQNPKLLHSGKTPKSTYDDMWAHLTRGEAWKGEFVNRRKDGSEYIELALISPVFQPDGRMTNYLAVKENITERKQMEDALRDSRENLRRLLNSMAEGAYGVDNNGNCTFVNQAFLEMLGYQDNSEILGKHIHELIHHSYPDGSPYPESECRAYCSYRTDRPITASDEVFWRKDGVAIPVEYWSHTIVTGGVSVGAIVTFFDITGRKAAEAKITRQTQLYAALSLCNEAIVRCNSEQELFPEICQDAVQFGGMTMAWIGMVDEASKQVRPVASYGTGLEYLEGIQISVDADDPFGRGPAGTAIRENRPYWCQDFEHDPALAPWRDGANKARWGAMAVLPLHRNDSTSGILLLYSDTVNAFDEKARRLLTEMAIDISFALDNFAHEAERKQAVQELLDSEQRFRGLVEQSLAGIYIIQDNKCAYVNPRTAEILGHDSAEDLIGCDPLSFVVESDRNRVAEALRKLLEREQDSISLEFSALVKDGTEIMVGANASYASYHNQPAVIGLIQDISVKKRDEERILKYVEQLKSTFMSTVELATSLSEMRDPYTAGHERRVSDIAVAIATELGLDEQRVEGIKVAGYLHDIGKISIPAEILVKPGRLNATEYALVQGHAQASYDVLKIVPFPWPVATIALQHHERMDGSGYPNKLKGDEIILESRIMAVADVVEAMASHRPYRPGLGIDKALAEIERGSGTLYDPVVSAACLRMFREKIFALPPY